MVKSLVLFLVFTIIGCDMNSQQIVKPEKFSVEEIKFNTVSKKLSFGKFENTTDISHIKEIINYWFENKVKTDGFDGSLDVLVKRVIIDKEKKNKYFKITINMSFEFIEIRDGVNKKKTHTINVTDYGEIEGSFSIIDQENLTFNIMHQSIDNVSKKIKEIY